MQRLRLRSSVPALFFLAAFCFFLASMIDDSTLSLVAGYGNLVAGWCLFARTHRIVIEPREEGREFEPWGWKP